MILICSEKFNSLCYDIVKGPRQERCLELEELLLLRIILMTMVKRRDDDRTEQTQTNKIKCSKHRVQNLSQKNKNSCALKSRRGLGGWPFAQQNDEKFSWLAVGPAETT